MAFDPTKPVEVDEPAAGFDPAAPVEVVQESDTVRRIKSDKRFSPEQKAIRVAAAEEGAKAFKPDEPVSTVTRIVENAKASFGDTLLGTGLKSIQVPLPGDDLPGQDLPEVRRPETPKRSGRRPLRHETGQQTSRGGFRADK